MPASSTLQRSTKEKTSSSFTNIQNPAGVVDGGGFKTVWARLRAEGVSGTPTVTMKLQHALILGDEAEWKDLLTFTAFSHASSFPVTEIPAAVAFSRYLRWVFSATTDGIEVKFGIELLLQE